MSQSATIIASAGVAAIAIIGATVALCLGHIDGGTFAGIIGPLAGVGIGAGAHANGVSQGTK